MAASAATCTVAKTWSHTSDLMQGRWSSAEVGNHPAPAGPAEAQQGAHVGHEGQGAVLPGLLGGGPGLGLGGSCLPAGAGKAHLVTSAAATVQQPSRTGPQRSPCLGALRGQRPSCGCVHGAAQYQQQVGPAGLAQLLGRGVVQEQPHHDRPLAQRWGPASAGGDRPKAFRVLLDLRCMALMTMAGHSQGA